jgi:hypothetical protein
MPLIGTTLIGMGNSLLFVCFSKSRWYVLLADTIQISIQAYTVDAFTLYAASGLAANTITRSVMGATLPLAASKMYQTLGLGWGDSLLAFLALAMVPVPVLLMLHGEKMRMWNVERMKRL